MKNTAAYIVSFLTGAVISLMVVANTNLGTLTTNEVSMTVNQAIGVVLTTVILLCGRKNEKIAPPRQKAPWYMYFGGLFGLVVMICNFYTVINIGAALSMAAAVFGQSLMGLLMDLFGLFGLEKRKLDARRWLSVAVSFAGILIMSLASEGAWKVFYILMGILAGVVTMVQMSYNSSFAKRKGAIFSARQNALSGLIGTLVYSFILLPHDTVEGFARLPGTGLVTICLGGVLAIFVVSATNLIIPKIPAVHSSLLLSSGQILASLVFDKFSLPLLIGALVILAGIALGLVRKED